MPEMRKGTYYVVRNSWGGQHGTDIEEIQLTKKEFLERLDNVNRGYFITKSYSSAVYYTQD